MAEENKNSAPDVEYNDDGTKNPDYVAPKTGSESGDADTKKTGTDDKGTDDTGGGKKDEQVFDDTIDPTKPPEIPVRKSVLQHILARKSKKIDKLESKLKEGDPGYVAPDADGEDDEGENKDLNLSDDAVKAIDTKVKSAIAPLLGELASKADEAEMQELIASEPEAKKYLNHIKAYMAHEAYKGVSPTVIFHHLAYSSAQALGAKKKQAADLEAKQARGGGRAIVDTKIDGLPSAEDINNMSDADFEKMEEKVLQGGFLKK